jgi:glycine cleavage system transcriptional repressor
MARFAVTAIGADRPGIVAAVTGVLRERGGNLEDSAMTNLGGHFAIVLVVEAPEEETAGDLERALADAVAPLRLTVAVRPVDEAPRPSASSGSSWSVSVHGADHPGIVHRVTRLLADHGANVVDLSTRVVGSPDEPAYVLLLAITLPHGSDSDALGEELALLAAVLEVDVHLRPDEPDIL